MRKIKINKYPSVIGSSFRNALLPLSSETGAILAEVCPGPRSHEGRYVSSDLMKETIPEYAASNEAAPGTATPCTTPPPCSPTSNTRG